jgi:hypothetical protein
LPPYLFIEAANLGACSSPIRDGQVWQRIRLSPFIVDSRRRDPVSPAGDDALKGEQRESGGDQLCHGREPALNYDKSQESFRNPGNQWRSDAVS